MKKQIQILDCYRRSNQDTCLLHKPAVQIGEWVESGDLLADNSASMNGELAIGQNILVAYMPWEGFNYEDAILINERLVYDDTYTSIHIERYEIETKKGDMVSKMGGEQITREIPELPFTETAHLDKYGIASVGSWIEEGDILVGKVTPINKKSQTPYQRLLFKLLDKKLNSVRDSSLRAPKGIKANVIQVQVLETTVPSITTPKKPNSTQGVGLGPDAKNKKKIKKQVAKAAGRNSLQQAGLSNNNLSLFGDKLTPSLTVAGKKSYSIFPVPSSIGNIQSQNPTKDFAILQERTSQVLFPGLGRENALTNSNCLNLKQNKSPSTGGKTFTEKPGTSKVGSTQLLERFLQKYLEWPASKEASNGSTRLETEVFKHKSLTLTNLGKPTLELEGPLLKKGDLQNQISAQSEGSLKAALHITAAKAENLYEIELSSGQKGPSKKYLCNNEIFSIQNRVDFLKSGSIQSKKPSFFATIQNSSFIETKKQKGPSFLEASPTTLTKNIDIQLPEGLIPTTVHIYLAEKRKIQVGDKMAGRHGNKGILSNILPRQDMPYLPDGTPIDIVLNPLGVPSRMNVGQIYECLLGLAGKYLGEHYKIFPFDEIYGPEASRTFVFSKLFEARKKTGIEWLFDANSPGKIRIFDGRTGDCFDQPVTIGIAYMLKLVHMVDDKIHMRSTGPYSLVTQQPLRGRAKQGGQRLGEMEVWAIEGYGAAFVLLEMLTLKSDDMTGRLTLWSNLIFNKEISIGTPESFKVLICELQALCLDIGLYKQYTTKSTKTGVQTTTFKEISHLMLLP